jgi:AcrR family transcriptional regulator
MARGERGQARRVPAAQAGARRWAGHALDRAAEREAKHAAILRTAARCFIERGFHATSLDDVAAQLHITKPTLYYYVKSKDDILVEVLALAMEQIQDAVNASERAGVDGREAFRMFVRRYVEIMANDYGKCLVLEAVSHACSEQDRVVPTLRRIDAALGGLLERGWADGSLARCHPRIGLFALFGAMHWMARWYRSDGALAPDRIADEMLTLFEQGLAPRVGPARRGAAAGAARSRAVAARGTRSR